MDEEEEDEDDIPKSASALAFLGEGLSIYNKGVISRREATHLEKGAGVPAYSVITLSFVMVANLTNRCCYQCSHLSCFCE